MKDKCMILSIEQVELICRLIDLKIMMNNVDSLTVSGDEELQELEKQLDEVCNKLIE